MRVDLRLTAIVGRLQFRAAAAMRDAAGDGHSFLDEWRIIPMRKLLSLAVSCLVAVGSSGCMGTVAKRALSEVTGASAKAQPVPGAATSRFAQFQGVKINAPHSDLGGLVGARFTSALPGALREALVTGKDAPFSGGMPTMEINPEITFYSEAGGLGDILGSDSYAVVLYTLSGDGAPLGKVQVVTKTAAARTGDEDMAKASAKGLAQFFEKYVKRQSETRKKEGESKKKDAEPKKKAKV